MLKKKWLMLFAMIFLGLAGVMAAPENQLRTASAETENEEMVALVTAEDVWKEVYGQLMYGTENSDKVIVALAMAEVKERDVELMTSDTDHIVNYHGRRFAITDDEYQVLLKIVEAEAGGEDIVGKMLVANVVLNRLEIGFGGDTISDVVFDEGQFSPVASGRIFKVTPSEETIEAVERVLDGEDKSEGALYFMCRELASKRGIRWFDKNLKFLFKHGCHEFYVEKD